MFNIGQNKAQCFSLANLIFEMPSLWVQYILQVHLKY